MAGARVKLLLVESGVALGGTERVLWELATRLSPQRWEVGAWLSPAPAVDELAAALARAGITVERVPEVGSRWDWRGMLSTWSRLRRARPRILHLHHVWPAADRYASELARAAGVEHVVVTEHIVGRSHSGGQRALKRRELLGADAVTAVCGAVAESLMRDYGVERTRVRVVPNGADLPDEEREVPAALRWRERLGAGLRRPLWVCPGRLEEQKGQAVLLDALAALAERGNDFVVALAGEGSRRAALEARASELGLNQRVCFLGAVDALGPLLRAADVCVLPSLWEGLPLTLLEALARARPVVASAAGGIPEVVEDGVHGRLVPPGRPAPLAAALDDLQRRPEAARLLGERGAARVRTEFTWARVVEDFEAVYDDVLGLASFAADDALAPGAQARRRRA
jgi:glycosyltransferase involved in cell wall biosynthesis